MSEPAGVERTPPPGGGGGNLLTRRYGGVPGWGWVAIVSLIAGAVFWYINRKRSSAAAGANTSGPAAGPTVATCYDANGATVACSDPSAVGSNATDYFEALYAQSQGINSQLENLTPTVNETGQDADAIQAMLQNLPGSPSGPPGGGGGGPGPPPGRLGPVRNLRAVALSSTTARVTWQPPAEPPVPAGFGSRPLRTYTLQIEGKDRAPRPVGARTSVTVGGLRPRGHYTAVVTPSGGPPSSAAFTMPAGPRTRPPAEQPGGPIRFASA